MTDERLKLWFGIILAILVIVLAGVIAVGKVQQDTSYGLRELIALLGPVIGAWGNWAFSNRNGSKP